MPTEKLCEAEKSSEADNDKDEVWLSRYSSIFASAQQKGDLKYLTMSGKEGKRQYEWLVRQKRDVNLSPQKKHQLELLNEFGLKDIGKTQDEKWEVNYNKLLQYKQGHASCILSKKEALGNDELWKLFCWIQAQRRSWRKGTLSFDRHERLLQIGFEFERIKQYQKKSRFTQTQDAKWMEKFKAIKEICENHGNFNNAKHSNAYAPFAGWVHEQRFAFSRGVIAEHRKNLLDEIGFQWNP